MLADIEAARVINTALEASANNFDKMTVLDFAVVAYARGYEAAFGKPLRGKLFEIETMKCIAFMLEHAKHLGLDERVLALVLGDMPKDDEQENDALNWMEE